MRITISSWQGQKPKTPCGRSPFPRKRWSYSSKSTPSTQAPPGFSPPLGSEECTIRTRRPRCTSGSSRTPGWNISGFTTSAIPFATLVLQNGVDIKTVSAMLGRYDAGFTLRTYTHTTGQKLDEAAQTMGNLMAQVR